MAPKISLIAAVGENLELGAKNEMLWHLPDDFAWFVKHTKGHPIIMGRKTMESLGRPLKNRRNLVVTRNAGLAKEGFEIFPDVKAAIDSAKTTETAEIFVIGGGEIYKQCLAFTDRMYLTRVKGSFPNADTFFPVTGNDWTLVFSEKHSADERHQYDFEFQILERMHG